MKRKTSRIITERCDSSKTLFISNSFEHSTVLVHNSVFMVFLFAFYLFLYQTRSEIYSIEILFCSNISFITLSNSILNFTKQRIQNSYVKCQINQTKHINVPPIDEIFFSFIFQCKEESEIDLIENEVFDEKSEPI